MTRATTTPPPAPQTPAPPAACLCMTLLVSLLVGVTVGVLTCAGGVVVPLAIVAGITSGGTTIPCVFALIRYALGDRR